MSDGLIEALAGALGPGALEPHFQPIADLATGAIVGFEGLARWRTLAGAVLTGETVMAAGAALDLRARLSCAMIERALVAFAQAPWAEGVTVSVNAACPELASGRADAVLLDAAAAVGLAPGRIWLEITEDLPLLEPDAVRAALQRLRAQGVRIAVDDFGKGWANLAWLTALPLDGVKIDAAFVAAMDVDPKAAAVVRHALALARELGLETVAEGVAAPAQRAALAAMGCARGQGPLFTA